MTFISDNIQQASGGIDDIIKEYAPTQEGGSPQVDAESDVQTPDVKPSGSQVDGGSPSASEPKLDVLFNEKYRSVDDIRNALKRVESFPQDAELEYQELKKNADKFKSLEEKENALKNYNPYKNPDFYRLDKLMSENPDGAEIYKRLVFGDVTDLELIKLELLTKNPEVFKDSPDALQRKIERLFPGLNSEDSEDESYKDAYTDMRLEASRIRKELMAKFQAIDVPNLEAMKQSEVQKVSELKQSWGKHVSKIKEELKSIPVRVTDENKKIGLNFFEIDIPSDDAHKLAELAENYLIQNRIPYSDEAFEAIKDYVSKYWVLENLERYTTEVAEKASKAKDGKWRDIIHNPGKPMDKPLSDQGDFESTEENAMGDIRKNYLGV